jgi:hypothetical protein
MERLGRATWPVSREVTVERSGRSRDTKLSLIYDGPSITSNRFASGSKAPALNPKITADYSRASRPFKIALTTQRCDEVAAIIEGKIVSLSIEIKVAIAVATGFVLMVVGAFGQG